MNPGRGSKAKAKVVPLQKLFAAVGGLKGNPLVANGRKRRRRRRGNPRGMGSKARARMSTLAQVRPRDSQGRFLPYRANSLVVNGRRRRRGGKRRGGKHRGNPLVANGRQRRPNPLVANGRRRRRGRRGNPGGLSGVMTQVAAPLRRIPVVGPVLAASVMALSSAVAGGLAVYPIHWGLKHASPWVPASLRPFAFSVVGVLLSGAVHAFVPVMAYRGAAVVALASAGGAVDAYRRITGASHNLGDGDLGDGGYDYGDEDLGDEDLGEGGLAGDDGYGDAENVRPGEWAASNLMDAHYSGEDMSQEEAEFAGLGRRAFRQRFMQRSSSSTRGGAGAQPRERGGHQGGSANAGAPGTRWGWLIYWIGFDQFRSLSRLDAPQRRAVIQKARFSAAATAKRALESGVTDGDTSMEALEAAGLLATT